MANPNNGHYQPVPVPRAPVILLRPSADHPGKWLWMCFLNGRKVKDGEELDFALASVLAYKALEELVGPIKFQKT